MNKTYNDKLLYLKTKIRKVGAKKFAELITKLVEKNNTNSSTGFRSSTFKSKYS